MADTYTPNLDLTLMARGDRNWDATLNAVLSTLDAQQALGALAVRPAEDGPSTSLNVKVSAGTYRKSDGTAVAVAAVPALALAASSTSSIYLTDAGVVTVSTTGFPAATSIVPLAVVTTGSSAITSLADARRPLVSFGAVAGGGTVTSVGLTLPAGLSVTPSAITTAGTFAVSTSLSGVLKGTGSGFAAAVAGTDYVTPSGSITGTAANVTGTVALANGGTGQTSAAAGFNALSPLTTLGDVLYASGASTAARLAGNTTTTRKFFRQTGTGTASAAPAWDTVTPADVGLGNVENTALSTWAGSANLTTLGTIATGTWNGTAIAIANGGTGATSAGAAFNALSPLTTLGDVLYASGANTNARLAGNTTTTKTFLTQTGTGTVSAAPAWAALAGADLPAFVASGASHAPGAVPDPGATAGTTKFLREDATWAVPAGGTGGSGTVTTVSASVPAGLSVAVTNPTTTPAIAITTTLSGVLKGTGSGFAAATAGTDYVTPSGSITGTAANVTGTVALANGGTGQTTAAAGFNALSPLTTLGDVLYASGASTAARLAGNTTTTRKFLRQTGTGTVSAAPAWDTVTAADVGLGSVENTALSTWAGSANLTTLGTVATGTWNATTIGVTKGGTGATSAAAGFDALSPNTTLGDLSYRGSSGNVRLAGNTAATKKFLAQTGTGTVSAAPAWAAVAGADVPAFVASGASHAPGAVPDPGATAGTTKFLREDATWAVPAGGGSNPTATTGTAALAANYHITTGSTWLDTGLSISIPSAGTYLLIFKAIVDFEVTAGDGWISVRLYDVTGAAAVPSSAAQVLYTNLTGSELTLTGSYAITGTFTGASTVRLEVFRGDSGSSTWTISYLLSNTDGATSITYIKLS